MTSVRKQTEWWCKGIKEQIILKEKKWVKYLSYRTDKNYNEYKEQRKIAKEMVQKAKDNNWEDKWRVNTEKTRNYSLKH